jgi:hypothetical protein
MSSPRFYNYTARQEIPYHTHIHTHTYIYIYIYIYMQFSATLCNRLALLMALECACNKTQAGEIL